MAKTRSQTLHVAVKKEVCEDKAKLEQLLRVKNNTSKSKNTIAKNRTRTPAEITKVNSKNVNVNSNKASLVLPNKTFTRKKVAKEQIVKLISHIVNDKRDIRVAAKKVGLSQSSAYAYYKEYQDDPEHKIPEPKTGLYKRSTNITQQNIEDLIHYIVNDKINLTQASKKAAMRRTTAAKYYAQYLEDPERKIPLLAVRNIKTSRPCTLDEITDLINYIVRDKMSLMEAATKVNVSLTTARKHYLKYLYNPNHEILDPRETKRRSRNGCTADQISLLIGYIVNDGMSLSEASVKANMGGDTARKYYRRYLNDPEKNIPIPDTKVDRTSSGRHALDKIKAFFSHIIIDELRVSQAARKAKISVTSGQKYYTKYLANYKNNIEHKDISFSVEKMKRLVEIVQSEKITVSAAADMVGLSYSSAIKHYRQYLKDPNYEFPVRNCLPYTQESINRVIDYIERDKMSIRSAAKKVKMGSHTASKYYRLYQNDPEHKIPMLIFKGQTKKNSTMNKYTQIISDIYKNNPSIKPIYGNHDLELDASGINIKQEPAEEDTKLALETENI